MNAVQERARKIRKKYKFKNPSDIERVMDGEKLHMVRFPFPGRLQEMIVSNWVAIQSSLKDMRRIHELLAHALGHYLLHEGNQPFYHFNHDRVIAQQWEHQAWDFAFELLMPEATVERLLPIAASADELRDEFEVSEEFFQMRMLAYEAERDRNRTVAR